MWSGDAVIRLGVYIQLNQSELLPDQFQTQSRFLWLKAIDLENFHRNRPQLVELSYLQTQTDRQTDSQTDMQYTEIY